MKLSKSQPYTEPLVQTLVETAIKLAYDAFNSNNYRIRLIKISGTSPSRHRYTVDFGKEEDNLRTSSEFQSFIFQKSNIKLAKTDDLMDSLEMAENICNSVLNSLVKQKHSLNGYFDKHGQPVKLD